MYRVGTKKFHNSFPNAGPSSHSIRSAPSGQIAPINHNPIAMQTPTNLNKISLLLLFVAVVGLQSTFAQETPSTQLNSKSAYHNQLFFNRFLINPTFSLVRENKSYINILHRNQYATFADNDQNYFLGFSNKLNDRTALGASVYSQWSGVVQEFGFNANYATAVRLGEKNKLTFGTNLTYFSEGIDRNRIITADADNAIEEAQKENKLAIQPGVTLSLGQFDIGLYAQDLLKYNQTTNEFATNLGTKSVKASLQYTYEFLQNRGFFANARLMPLVQVGQNQDGSMNYVASMMLDLPDYGWFQTNFDQEYGISTGIGFNLSKKMSLGYLLERDIMNKETDLGWNHEVTLAYTLDREHNAKGLFAEGSEDEKVDMIVRNYEEQILALKEEVEQNKAAVNKMAAQNGATRNGLTQDDAAGNRIARNSVATNNAGQNKVDSIDENAFGEFNDRDVMDAMASMDDQEARELAYENRLVLDELMLRQDSIDAARTAEFDARLASLVDVLKDEIKRSMGAGQDADKGYNTAVAAVESKVEAFKNGDAITSENNEDAVAAVDVANNEIIAKDVISEDAVATVDVATTDVIIEDAITEDALAVNEAVQTQKEEAYTRDFEFESMDKVLGEVIARPAVTANAADSMKDGAKLPIKHMKSSALVGANSGYYVIANVYKSRKYLDAFMKDLKQKGLDAKYFYNKENGLHYVYLADYNYKEDAKLAYVSDLDGKYNAEKWIMQVDNASSIVENYYED